MRALSAVPDIHGGYTRTKASPRCKALLAMSEAGVSGPGAGSGAAATSASPRSRRLAAKAPAASLPPAMATLKALEKFLDDARALPEGSPHRLQAARSVLSVLIAQLPAHGPLLSLVKQAYDDLLAPTVAKHQPHALHPIHPLQLQAANHEATLRHTVGRMRRVDAEVVRVARLKARLRTGVLETTRRYAAARTRHTRSLVHAQSRARPRAHRV
eukprot:6289712-Prymnesium_polylepis.2